MEENNSNDLNENNLNNDEVIKTKAGGSYLVGTIGAVIGAAIASIPWILVYVYGNTIAAILAILIALGAFQGYKIFKGKIGKALPVIIAVISIIVVLLLTTVICPMLMLANADLEVSFETVQKLYEDHDMSSAIMQDTVISLIFTVLGIASVIRSINMQIKSGSQDIKFSEQPLLEDYKKQLKEKAEVVKKAFEGLGALSKDSAAEKNEILNELEMTYNLERKVAKADFQMVYATKIIKKANGKYYYDVENEENNLNNIMQVNKVSKKNISTAIAVFIIVFAISMAVALMFDDGTTTPQKVTIPKTNIEVNVTDDVEVLDTAEKIEEALGEEYVNYYDFIAADENREVELYTSILDKSQLEEQEYTVQSLIEEDRSYSEQLDYENITEIQTKKIGNLEFSWYSFNYGDTEKYLGNILVADTENSYMYIEVYTSTNNQERIDEFLKTLFE